MKFHKIARRKQAGVTQIQITVGVAVVGLAIVGGMFLFKYIEQQKVKNELSEVADVRGSAINYATQHSGRYTDLTLETACAKDFFPAGRCTGTGATTSVTNSWGGAILLSIVNLTGPGTGAQFTYAGLSSSACIQEATDLWHHAARIAVGTTAVKTTTTQVLVDKPITDACKAAADNADLVWTFGTN